MLGSLWPTDSNEFRRRGQSKTDSVGVSTALLLS